jgi:hypothetical protein
LTASIYLGRNGGYPDGAVLDLNLGGEMSYPIRRFSIDAASLRTATGYDEVNITAFLW